MSPHRSEYKILIPITNFKEAPHLVRLASGILRQRSGKVIVLAVVEVPDVGQTSQATLEARTQRRLLREVSSLGQEEHVETKTLVRVSPQVVQGIREVVAEEKVSLLLMGWKGRSRRSDRVFSTIIDDLVKAPPCDIAVVKQRSLEQCRSILLPVRGGPHAELALELALSIAERFDATVTIMHIELADRHSPTVPPQPQTFADFAARTKGSERTKHLVVTATSVEEAILAESARHQLVIMGAAARPGRGGSLLFGSIPERVAAQAKATVIVTKTREPLDISTFAPERLPLNAVVDKWFAENTFHGREFNDVDELVRLKQQKRLTISLGIPTMNEASTIGSIINILKGELMERRPLLDEIVVFDGGSTDDTVKIAQSYQVPVYDHRRILPNYGTYPGKGDALWKGLSVLRGDIIAWVDADVKNMHPKLVYGVVGPLLKDDQLAFVKGFSSRHLSLEEYETNRDRLTELTARPLINLFFPELSGLLEPLGAGYAGRRDALENTPVFAGFGVEMGLAIDMWRQFGLRAIGQSDLEQIIIREKSLSLMSQRAFAIIQVVMRRLEERNQARILEGVEPTMKVIRRERERFSLEVLKIAELERPPISTIAEYAESGSHTNALRIDSLEGRIEGLR